MLPDNEYYHRSSIDFMTNETNSLKKKITELKKNVKDRIKLGRNENEDIFGRVWNMYNFLVNYDVDEFFLASMLDSKGSGALTADVGLLGNKDFYCDLPLIKDGIIVPMGNEGQREQARYTAVSDFIVPETVYNPFGINPKLPEVLSSKSINYVPVYIVKISDNQASRRYYSTIGNLPKHIIDLINEKKAIIVFPFQGNASGPPTQLRMMINSSSAAMRLSTTEVFGKISKPVIKPTSPIIEDLKPFPLAETEMDLYFRYILERELSKYCSYAYKDNQFKLFTSGTNHIINGKVVGGINVALYYDDVKDIQREMLESNPNIHVKNATFLMYMVFASLYPPEDEENFKKYGVCINPLRYSTVFREWDMFCDCSNQIFKVYPNKDDPDYQRSYCTFTVPFDSLANECIPTFARYLPFEDAEGEVQWKDVIDEEASVYTQVRMFVSNTLRVEDLASTIPRLEHARMMVGCPCIDGSLLQEYSILALPRMLGIYTNSDVFERYVRGEGATYLYNMYCCAQSLRCTPTDFKVASETNDISKKQKEPAEKIAPLTKMIAIRYEEVAHKEIKYT